MYIRRVRLENLKGFRDLDFTFENKSGELQGWCVITGDNGSGKTALLKSIVMAIMGPEYVRVLQPRLSGWIRKGAAAALISVELLAHDEDKFTKGRRPAQTFWAHLQIESPPSGSESGEPSIRKASLKKKKSPVNGPWSDRTSGWFIIGYGPFRRLYGHSPDAQRMMVGPPRIARLATMFREDATLSECELWLIELNHKALEQNAEAQMTKDAVIALLNDDFLQHHIRIDRVDSDGLWAVDAQGNILPLRDLSEGYRAALAMMVDILRHFAGAFASEFRLEKRVVSEEPLVFEPSDNEAPPEVKTAVERLKAKAEQGTREEFFIPLRGVVLVDEMDAHLHPEWQRTIGPWLRRRFPYVQFIVTTHSPLVSQAAADGRIYILPPPGSAIIPQQLSQEDFRKIAWARPEDLLTSPIFGLKYTRSPVVLQDMFEFSRLRSREARGLTAKERARLQQLLPFAEESMGHTDAPSE
jgi:hypothetical protein